MQLLKKIEKFSPFLIGILFLAGFIRILKHQYLIEGDTASLLSGSRAALGCFQSAAKTCISAMHFPFFQYLSSISLMVAGYSDNRIYHFFAYLNGISFIGTLLLGVLFLRKKNPITPVVFALGILVSPLLWYAHTTFNEMTNAFINLAFVICCVVRAPFFVIAFLALLCGICKETAYPFIFLLGMTSLFPGIIREPRKQIVPTLAIATGLLLALASNLSWNLFRFGTVSNIFLMQDNWHVHSVRQVLIFFFGIFASPNGGILFFWPVATAVCVSVWLLSLKDLRDLRFLPALISALLVSGLAFGFSLWFAPFGWIAWGPRLMTPWLPSVFFLSLYFYSRETEIISQWVLEKTFRFTVFVIVTIAFSLPHIFIIFNGIALSNFFQPDAAFPRIAYIDEPNYYYPYLNHLIWPKNKFLFKELMHMHWKLDSSLFFLTYVFSLLVLFFLARRTLPNRRISP